MKRYNQYFGKLGPLKQCKNGKLIEYKDHNEIVNYYEKRMSELYDDLSNKDELVNESYREIYNLEVSIVNWKTICVVQLILSGILLGFIANLFK